MSDKVFIGVIIEESLADKTVLNKVKIIKTKIEKITKKHKTPWLKQWTLHTVEIPEDKARAIAEELSGALQPQYWYADFKNKIRHFIIFRNIIFDIDRKNKEQYKEAKEYGLSLGIPEYQIDFKP
ncbi:MAG: hypothetical protein Q7S22_01175 [Candidatus Micrarchaeota archaeon]|nr:hypothetical protein [Candidatus Micrarchaeota archaeon]